MASRPRPRPSASRPATARTIAGATACALVTIALPGCGTGTDETAPADGDAVVRVAARTTVSLDGGVPVAPGGPVARGATLTAFPARTLLRVGDTTYATGVGWIGAHRGSGLLLSPRGALRGGLGTDGQLSDAVPDGRGGAYLGGELSRAGGLRRSGVVRVRADGTVDPRFRVRGLRFVNALVRDGDVLYAGGALGPASGRATRGLGLVALDARTGRRLRGFRAPATGRVSELALHGGRLYVGGAFPDPRFRSDGRGGLVRVRERSALPVAALDPRTGRRVRGFVAPRLRLAAGGQVTALRVVGGRLWVGSGLPGSYERGRVQLLDPRTGAVRAAPEARGAVLELVPDGSRVVALGALVRRGGGRDLAQTFDARSGARVAGPTVAARSAGEVAADGLLDDGRLVLVGAGRRTGGPAAERRTLVDRGPVRPSGFVRVVDGRTGGPEAGPRIPVPDSNVNALVRLRGGLIAGGSFATVDPVATDLAAFDARTGRPSAAPVPRIPGVQTATAAGGTVWVSDGFDLVAFDPATGAVRHRTPLPFRGGIATDPAGRYRTAARVRLTAAGGRVFVTGGPSGRRDGPRGIAAYDASTGRRVPFLLPLLSAPLGDAPQLLGVGDALYAAGSFERRRPSGQPANLAVLKVDPRTGALDEAFDPHVDGAVAALGTQGPGQPLYLAGAFRSDVAGPSRPGSLIAVDPATGQRTPDVAAVPLDADPNPPLSATADRVVVRRYETSLVGVAYGRSGRRVRLAVRGSGFPSTTDGSGLLAAGAPLLLGAETPAQYGLVARIEGR